MNHIPTMPRYCAYGMTGRSRHRTDWPFCQFDSGLEVKPPALIKGYLRLEAKVLGAPAWDPDFNSADLPMLMRIEDLPARYRRHFLRTCVEGLKR